MIYNRECEIDPQSVRIVNGGRAGAVGVDLVCAGFGSKTRRSWRAVDHDKILLREFPLSVFWGAVRSGPVRSLLPKSAGQRSASGAPPFPDAAAGDDSLVSARSGDHGVNFETVIHDDEVCDHRRPAIGEVDGEGSRAIGIHRVSPGGSSMGKVSDDLTAHSDRVDLGKPTLAIKLSHRHAYLWAGWSLAPQFVALDGESIVASDEFVIAGSRVTLRVS